MIRRWVESDTARVAEIERLCFDDAWTEQMLAETLANPAFTGFVWARDGCVCGYVGMLCSFDAEVALIAVSPEARREGIGEKLLSHAIDFVQNKGADKVFLEVRVSNAPAKALYLKAGFKPVAIRKGYYSNGEDALVMVLER